MTADKARKTAFVLVLALLASGSASAQDAAASAPAPDDSAPRLGISIGLSAHPMLPSLTMTCLGTAAPEILFRLQPFEMGLHLRLNTSLLSLVLGLDVRLAPRSGAYVPAVGIGVAWFACFLPGTSLADSVFGAYAMAAPLLFDVGPLLSGILGRPAAPLFVSFLEIRCGPILPRSAPRAWWEESFLLELTLTRLTIMF